MSLARKIVVPERSYSGENEEDLYEEVDPLLEDTKIPSTQYHNDDQGWSDNEFDDVEEIYCNESELTPVVESPAIPVLPPRPRGQQNEIELSAPSLPPRTLTSSIAQSSPSSSSSSAPPPLPDYKITQESIDDDSYEEFPKVNASRHSGGSESDGEDYEIVNQMPSRSNRPCPSIPIVTQPSIEETYVETEPELPSKPEAGIVNKMKNMKQQMKSRNFEPASPVNRDLHETDNSIPTVHKNVTSFSRPLPKSPSPEETPEEEYEITDGPTPPIPYYTSDTKPSTVGTSKSKRSLPIPSPQDEKCQRNGQKPMPSPRLSPCFGNKSRQTEPLDGTNNYESDNQPITANRISPIPKKIQENSQHKDSDSTLAIKRHRLVPYTPVVHKAKTSTENVDDTQPSLLVRLKPVLKTQSNTGSNKNFSETKHNSDSKTSSSFVFKERIASMNLQSEFQVKTADASDKNIDSKQFDDSGKSKQTINQQNKGNYPKHIPPKLKTQNPVESENEESTIFMEARSKLKNIKKSLDGNLSTRGHDPKAKDVKEGTPRSIAVVTPLKKTAEPLAKCVPKSSPKTLHESRNPEELHSRNTRGVNDKVISEARKKSNASYLMNLFEQKLDFGEVRQTCLSPQHDETINKKTPSLITENIITPRKIQSTARNDKERKLSFTKTSQIPAIKDQNKNKLSGEVTGTNSSVNGGRQSVPTILTKKTKIETSDAKTQKSCPWKGFSVSYDVERVSPGDNLANYPWFLANKTREDAARKLKLLGKDGSFLIRNSQKTLLAPYSLSVLCSGKIFNLIIRKRTDDQFAIGSEKAGEKAFASLEDLVSYHASNPIEILGEGNKVYLLFPANE